MQKNNYHMSSRDSPTSDDDNDGNFQDELRFREQIKQILSIDSSCGVTLNHEVPQSSNQKQKTALKYTDSNKINAKLKYDKKNHGEHFLQQIVGESWARFSAKHGISPFSINNNVTKRQRQTSNNGNILRKIKDNHLHHQQPASSNEKSNGFDQHQNTPVIKHFAKFIFWSLKLFYVIFKIIGIATLTLFVFYCIFILHKPTQRFISRNTQDLIYPLMRALRLMSIPIIQKFPILQEYYEESCLIPNPYYQVAELECWPCFSVRHVMDLTGFSNFSAAYHHSGIPFLVKDAFPTEVNMQKIRKIVSENPDMLGKSFVETNHFGVTMLENILGPQYSEAFNSEDFHLQWYINRVVIARLWRKYFPKPYFIPKTTEVSVQHFLYVDRPLAKTYRLPLTEFANVFLTQASGSRSIVLIPTKNCQDECKVVSAVLKPKDVLFYNWLFWRPMSVAADSTSFQSTSVTFIGSFY